MCGLLFSTGFVWNISHSKKNRVWYDQKCILVFMWSTLYPSQLLTWIFWAYFRKILKYRISWTSVPWERSCSMLAGGPTDRRGTTKLKVALRNFANAPLMVSILSLHCNVDCYSAHFNRHPALTRATCNTNQHDTERSWELFSWSKNNLLLRNRVQKPLQLRPILRLADLHNFRTTYLMTKPTPLVHVYWW